jgi:hypothetical protein
LWFNQGNGVFTISPQSFGAFGATDAVALDYNGDGHTDFWLGNGAAIPQPDQVWTNDGNGVFGVAESFGNRRTLRLAAGDFTGDGQTDIFAATADGDSVLWARAATGSVPAYAASFGLSGADTAANADPYGDGIINAFEYAFNLNPALADAAVITDLGTATNGLPAITVVLTNSAPTFIAYAVRRITPPDLTYRLETGSGLQFNQITTAADTTPINGIFERATYQVQATPGTTNESARFIVIYEP